MSLHTHFYAMIITSVFLAACGPASDEVAVPEMAAPAIATPEPVTNDMAAPDVVVLDQDLIARIISDDVVYLTQLGLMRGHLFVGVSLYREGEHQAAVTHMKHPESELFAELQPGLEARGVTDFSVQLQALAVAVENEAPLLQVDQNYEDLVVAIRLAEAATADLSAAQIAQVIRALLGHVSYEYGIAVDANGILQSAHEYQDCLGFVQVANGYIEALQERSNQAASIQGLRQQMAFLQEVFPTTVPSTREPLTQPATVNEVITRIGVTLAGFPL